MPQRPPVRIANCSGFYGDRIAAAREMLDQGSGPIDAMVNAIGLPFDVLSYEEHSRGHGSGANAVSYIEITTRSRRTLFGAGAHPNIITASLLALLSAANRAVAQGVLPARPETVRNCVRNIS